MASRFWTRKISFITLHLVLVGSFQGLGSNELFTGFIEFIPQMRSITWSSGMRKTLSPRFLLIGEIARRLTSIQGNASAEAQQDEEDEKTSDTRKASHQQDHHSQTPNLLKITFVVLFDHLSLERAAAKISGPMSESFWVTQVLVSMLHRFAASWMLVQVSLEKHEWRIFLNKDDCLIVRWELETESPSVRWMIKMCSLEYIQPIHQLMPRDTYYLRSSSEKVNEAEVR